MGQEVVWSGGVQSREMLAPDVQGLAMHRWVEVFIGTVKLWSAALLLYGSR